jgi:3-aminobutyryl-CoA ammonia-lyase
MLWVKGEAYRLESGNQQEAQRNSASAAGSPQGGEHNLEGPWEVVIRLRMSEHDAHYGGRLVDGARMLGLFGDVATELLIRHDGDEGLFVAYDCVEFKAPVYAGDYIEAKGRITKVGRTSRRMEFVAQKVIEANIDPLVPSAANFLEQPVVVTYATGTCVVPEDKQRMKTSNE